MQLHRQSPPGRSGVDQGVDQGMDQGVDQGVECPPPRPSTVNPRFTIVTRVIHTFGGSIHTRVTRGPRLRFPLQAKNAYHEFCA